MTLATFTPGAGTALFTEGDRTSGWVDLTGGLFSRPLLPHPIVTLLARDATCPSPVPEP